MTPDDNRWIAVHSIHQGPNLVTDREPDLNGDVETRHDRALWLRR
jgi:hypothetical protein